MRHAEDRDPSDLERWHREHHTLLLIQKSHTHLMSVVQEEEERNTTATVSMVTRESPTPSYLMKHPR